MLFLTPNQQCQMLVCKTVFVFVCVCMSPCVCLCVFQTLPGGATIIRGLASNVLGTAGTPVVKPGPAVAQTAAGKQTIVIASPRPAGATPAKIMTAVPKGVAGTPGAQYIVMTTRPGTPGSGATSVPGTTAAGRVISMYQHHCYHAKVRTVTILVNRADHRTSRLLVMLVARPVTGSWP